MARAAVAVFVVVLLGVALLPVRAYLTEPREVIASTPSAYTGLTVPIELPAGSEACADEILFDTNARIARFGAAAPDGGTAPPLDVVARGLPEGEYSSDHRSAARVDGGWSGTRRLDVPIDPPDEAVFGTFCVRNAGDRPVELVGSENGRAYSRPTVRVDGEAIPIDLQLRLMEPGRKSLISRADQVMAQAATLKPFGAGWWWLLTLGLVTLAPLGVLLALRAGLADVADVERPRAPLSAWPSERLRRRVEAIPGWAILAAVGTVAVAWFFYWAFNTHSFQNDEDQYVYLSRWLQNDFPASLWNFDMYARGLQRLEVWLLAIPSALFDAPWSLHGGRFLNTVAFVSTCVPVYLLGRGMGLRSQWAALPAAVSVLVPWAVVTTSFLTENVAYPACLWAVWGIWRAAVAPAPWRDLVALVLVVVAGASRSALLVLAPVLPLAVLLIGMRCGVGGPLSRLRALLRDHVVLWIAVAAAAAPLLLGPLGVGAADDLTRRLAGGYPTQANIDAWTLLEKSGRYFSRVVVGTGILPAVVALPWLVAQLARSRDVRRFAFATVVVLSAAALLYSLAPAGPDERYIVYLAPLVLLPATLALANREISPVGLGIASVLLAALLIRVTWIPEQGPYGFFVWPVEMFYARAVGLRFSGMLPGDGTDALTLVGVGLGAAGVALAVLLRRTPERLGGRAAALLVAGVVASVLVQTHYTFTKYANGAGAKSGPDMNARAFADRLVPDDATVGAFLEGVGQTPDSLWLWQEVQFYNERIETEFALGPNQNPIPPGDGLVDGVAFDDRTGAVTSRLPLTDYLVIPSQVGVVRLRGEIVYASSYIAFALQRVARPATLAWRTTGFDPLGVVPENGTGTIRFFGAGLSPGPQCATLTLAAPRDAEAGYSVRSGGRQAARGTLAPGERRVVRAPLPRLTERQYLDVAVRGDGLQVLTADLAC
jgi:hypothetical protein